MFLQESFVFYSERVALEKLEVADCPKLTLLAGAVSPQSSLATLTITNVSHIELHAESVSVSRLRRLAISHSAITTIHSGAFKASMVDSPAVSISIENVRRLNVKSKAFAGIRSFTAMNVEELLFEPNAFKLKVPTEEPTINLTFWNISSPALSPNVFPSSFKSVTISQSSIEKVNANAFSGLQMVNITFAGVSIARIERGAFSDRAGIGSLTFRGCNISSLSQKSVVAGVSRFIMQDSVIQSISKHGAINATVATVHIVNNRFRTLGQESFQFISWDSVIINNNTFDFLEQGSLNAVKAPSEDGQASFSFTDNFIGGANYKSLQLQVPAWVEATVRGNRFGQTCSCKLDKYLQSVTGHTDLSSPFLDLTPSLRNSSSCRVAGRGRLCFPSPAAAISRYTTLMCTGPPGPACARQPAGPQEDLSLPGGNSTHSLYLEFQQLFQVKTTKGILLFLLFCVLSSVITVSICVGSIWVHR